MLMARKVLFFLSITEEKFEKKLGRGSSFVSTYKNWQLIILHNYDYDYDITMF